MCIIIRIHYVLNEYYAEGAVEMLRGRKLMSLEIRRHLKNFNRG